MTFRSPPRRTPSTRSAKTRLACIAAAVVALIALPATALVPAASAQETPPGWRVTLRVETPAKAVKARATLGQFPGSVVGYDGADLATMAPFAAPWLTLVFPHADWGAKAGDYATDFRAFDNAPGQWLFEMRADRAGATVVLRWEGDPAILARSRLTDKFTGRVIDPTDPAYANGYPVTLNPAIRPFSWDYLGP
ncbi:hypothetical protein WOC76_23685 [Methylocystis sp. IM3]|uniref:hypothetical protein n=1 Tax=unclassified Methylocystis TaxID=2625913 RepID=UPI003119CA5B